MSKFYIQIPCELDANYSVIIEDDGRVAYAYLMAYEDIIGDVWLYNQQESPQQTTWDATQMPFLNPAEYIDNTTQLSPIKDESDVRCEWDESPDDGTIEVSILIRGKFIAQLVSGSKPGWSTLVVKDGPLALVY